MNDEEYGNHFQEKSKYIRENLTGRGLDWNKKPKIYKKYPNCPKTVLPRLIPENINSKLNFTKVIKQRKRIRVFKEKLIEIDQISYLLWTSAGIQRIMGDLGFRTAPSAGSLYPIETYLLINDCQYLEQGFIIIIFKIMDLNKSKKEITLSLLQKPQ